jgi:hypothetical protein
MTVKLNAGELKKETKVKDNTFVKEFAESSSHVKITNVKDYAVMPVREMILTVIIYV